MSNPSGMNLDNVKIDPANLHREDMITDLKVGSIQRLTPIKIDGSDDDSRPVQYIGQTQIMSQAGPLPIQAPIEAANLEEAVEKFPAAVKVAVDKLIEEAREYQRQEASRIVVPGQDKGNGIIMP